jgi:hypothetical protein
MKSVPRSVPCTANDATPSRQRPSRRSSAAGALGPAQDQDPGTAAAPRGTAGGASHRAARTASQKQGLRRLDSSAGKSCSVGQTRRARAAAKPCRMRQACRWPISRMRHPPACRYLAWLAACWSSLTFPAIELDVVLPSRSAPLPRRRICLRLSASRRPVPPAEPAPAVPHLMM